MTNYNKMVGISPTTHSKLTELQKVVAAMTGLDKVSMGQAVSYAINFTIKEAAK